MISRTIIAHQQMDQNRTINRSAIHSYYSNLYSTSLKKAGARISKNNIGFSTDLSSNKARQIPPLVNTRENANTYSERNVLSKNQRRLLLANQLNSTFKLLSRQSQTNMNLFGFQIRLISFLHASNAIISMWLTQNIITVAMLTFINLTVTLTVGDTIVPVSITGMCLIISAPLNRVD